MTSSGFTGFGTCGPEAASIHKDAFFQWTSTFDGDYVIDTVGSSFDTKLSVHSGADCGSICVGFDDNGGPGNLSRLTLTGTTVGSTYLIQVGGTGSGEGQAQLNIASMPTFGDDAFEDNASCAEAVAIPLGLATDLVTKPTDSDFYLVTIPSQQFLSVDVTDVPGAPVGLRLFDPACNLLSDTQGDFSFGNQLASTTTYRLEAYSILSGATGAGYSLDMSVSLFDRLFDDRFEENDDCGNAALLGPGTYEGLIQGLTDSDFYAVDVPAGNEVRVDMMSPGSAQADFQFYGTGCTLDPFLDDRLRYTNTSNTQERVSFDVISFSSLGNCAMYQLDVTVQPNPCLTHSDDMFEDNETCGTATPIRLGTYPNMSAQSMDLRLEVIIRDYPETNFCNIYTMELTGVTSCDAQAVPFCDPMTNNSSGLPTSLGVSFGSIQATVLHLEATQGPASQFGYFLAGSESMDPGVAVGQGLLCLTGSVGRFNVTGRLQNSLGRFDSSGRFINLVGTASSTAPASTGYDVPLWLPFPGTVLVESGSTWNFQLWHRDGVGSSNFSNGLAVTF